LTIVMGLDQPRAQVTADWLDTSTRGVPRARVAPADCAGVRRLLDRLRDYELDVALAATTGWQFVVEGLRRVGAAVHPTEAAETAARRAETAARRGNKERAKNDRADARHLRKLLMIVRARVRLRHTLSE
jgi:transposase